MEAATKGLWKAPTLPSTLLGIWRVSGMGTTVLGTDKAIPSPLERRLLSQKPGVGVPVGRAQDCLRTH